VSYGHHHHHHYLLAFHISIFYIHKNNLIYWEGEGDIVALKYFFKLCILAGLKELKVFVDLAMP
jgi:hypothetical protein